MKPFNRMGRLLSSIWRGWRLCCPRCGEHTLFRRWFTMYEQCAACRLKFEREQGYFLGAMYINYAMTVGVVLVGYFVLEWVTDMPLVYQLVLWGSVSVLCPLLLFRRSRGLWLALDYFVTPADDALPNSCEERPGEWNN